MDYKILIIVFAIILILALGLVMFVIIKARNISNLFKKAEDLRGRAQYDVALKIYLQIIKRLEKKIDRKSNDIKQFLGKSYLGCGIIYENTSNKKSAFEYYRMSTSNGVALNTGLINFSAVYCSENEIVDDFSIRVFVQYLVLKPTDRTSIKISELLSKAFYINEKSDEESLSHTLKLCERILEVKGKNVAIDNTAGDSLVFEWVYYYAGLVYFLRKDYKKAVVNLGTANKISKTRQLAGYWFPLAMMEQLAMEKEQNIKIVDSRYKAVINSMSEFLKTDSKNNDFIEKQSLGSYKIGVFIIDWILGTKTGKRGDLAADKQQLLKDAVNYLLNSNQLDVTNSNKAIYYAACAYSLLGNSKEAIKNFMKCSSYPDKKEVLHYQIASEYFYMEQYDLAINSLLYCLELNNHYIEGWKLLFFAYIKVEKFTLAEQTYQTLVSLKADDQETKCYFITVLYQQNRTVEIVSLVNNDPQAFKPESLPDEIRLYTGIALARTKSWNAALPYFINVSTNPEYQYYHALVLANLSFYDQAVKILSALVTHEPKLSYKINLLCGNVYLKLEKFDKARNCYKAAFEIHPDNIELIEAFASYHYNTNSFELAKSLFTRSYSMDNYSFLSCQGLGLIHEKEGNIDEAIRYFELAINLKKEDTLILKLGILFAKKEKFNKALSFLQQYAEINPDNSSNLYYAGYCYAKTDLHDKAIECWTKLYEKNKSDKQLYADILRLRYKKGISLARQGLNDEAIIELQAYVDFFNEDKDTLKLLAQQYFKAGNRRIRKGDVESLKTVRDHFFTKAVDIYPAHEYIFYLSLIQIELKEYKSARTSLKELLKSDYSQLKYKYYLAIAEIQSGNNAAAKELLKSIVGSGSVSIYQDLAKKVLANEFIRENNLTEAINFLEYKS